MANVMQVRGGGESGSAGLCGGWLAGGGWRGGGVGAVAVEERQALASLGSSGIELRAKLRKTVSNDALDGSVRP